MNAKNIFDLIQKSLNKHKDLNRSAKLMEYLYVRYPEHTEEVQDMFIEYIKKNSRIVNSLSSIVNTLDKINV